MQTIKRSLINNQIVWAEINRPDARNAINFQVIDELEEIVAEVRQDERITTFILSGSGTEAFVSGGDLKEFHTIKSEEKAIEMSERMHRLLSDIEQLPCWTIACINGFAYGGGIEILLAFDFHIASEAARFGFTQGKFYLSPGWGGLTRLIEKTGKSKALQLLAESAVLGAEEVSQLGIIERTIPAKQLLEETTEWAIRISRNDRDYIRTLKQTAAKIHPERLAMLKEEIEPFAKLWVHDEHNARVERFIQKKNGN